jgi:hypothetical protein
MGEGYRLGAGPASSSVQPEFEAFVVAPRPRLSGGHRGPRHETGGTRSDPAATTGTERRRQMSATATPHFQFDAAGVPSTLLFLVLVLTALGVFAHAAFI